MKTIQELREAYGWNHYELAVRLGVRPATIRDWEDGRSRPRSIQLRRVAEVFGVPQAFIDLNARAPEQSTTDSTT